MLDAIDILQIQRVLSLYSHIVDGREWGRLGEVFDDAAVFDADAHGKGVSEGLAALRARWEQSPPARLHHHTDTVVDEGDAPGSARALSKAISTMGDGGTSAGAYRDDLRRTSAGWRIVRRVAVPLTIT